MAKTNPFDVTTPGGSDDPKQGDDRIRELKAAIQEREDEDHYWEQIGDIVDEDNVGFHRKVTLLVGSAPSLKADAGILYTKDISEKAELHYRNEDGDEVQLTSGDAASGASPFRSGDMMTSKNTSAPSGWSDVSATYEDRFMRITSGTPLDTGGANTHTTPSHTLTIAQMPAHGHPYLHSRDGGAGGGQANSAGANADTTGSTGGGGGHVHGAADNVPTYVEVRLFQKD